MTTTKTPARRRPQQRRILIVDGVSVWREATTSRIKRCSDLKVCGEAVGEKIAFETVRQLRPRLCTGGWPSAGSWRRASAGAATRLTAAKRGTEGSAEEA